MAGHSKWHNIKHRKAAVDKKRGSVWTKCAKAIIVAAQNGGPDPASNLTLRYAIDEARYANMPRDTIDRAIKKGAGGGDTGHFESVRYEGYGPGGAAFIVDALTDNRTRTATEVRGVFNANGGNLGSTGSVGYLFDMRGRIEIPAMGLTEDRVFGAAVEAGALDVESPPHDADEGAYLVLTDPLAFQAVKESLEAGGIPISRAELAMIPQTRVEVAGDAAKANMEISESLEELDDVQKVYSNFDLGEADLAALAQRKDR